MRILAIVLMVSVGFVSAELSPVDRKLDVDVLVWTGAHFWRLQQSGLGRNEFVFEPGTALVGVTGIVTPVASLRVSCDVANVRPQDAYADARWSSGLGLRFGQFRLPLGADFMTSPAQLKLISNSLLAAYARPVDERDVGAMGSWVLDQFDVALAVVNGSGPNRGDNNDRRDLCGRMACKPWRGAGVYLAARGYYGWPDSAKSAWRTIAVEVGYERSRAALRVEVQNLESAKLRNKSGYVQFAYDLGLFEPTSRFDLVLPTGQRPDIMATAGVNAKVRGDNLKVMLSVGYRRDMQGGLDVLGLNVRLQAAL